MAPEKKTSPPRITRLIFTFGVIPNEFSRNLTKVKESKTGSQVDDNPEVYGIKIFEKHFEKPDHSVHCNLIDINNQSRILLPLKKPNW
jgi:hypothetical protein